MEALDFASNLRETGKFFGREVINLNGNYKVLSLEYACD